MAGNRCILPEKGKTKNGGKVDKCRATTVFFMGFSNKKSLELVHLISVHLVIIGICHFDAQVQGATRMKCAG
jgi:hypothetical protein